MGERVARALRPDTLLVSLMHANNETGVVQPMNEIAEAMKNHAAWLHVDAAQSFGKQIASLRNPRAQLISISTSASRVSSGNSRSSGSWTSTTSIRSTSG